MTLLADLDAEEASLIRVLSGSIEEAFDDFGNPDLVNDHGIWLPCHREVARICRERGIPRIVSPRGMLEPWALNHKKWKKRLAWWLYQGKDLWDAAALHATADQEAAQLRKLGFKQKILVAANGVMLPNVDKLKSEWRTALFLSRIHPKKGLPMLIEAWARLQPDGWRMRVVGPDEGGHRKELEARVKDAGLADSWSFEEGLEGADKWRAMADADLFVLPSHSENFGIVVAEALACGTPVIATTGTPWEGLLKHRCGWWVKPAVDELGAALNEALGEADKSLLEMGSRGRRWVARDFAWNGIAHESQCFYQLLLVKEPDSHGGDG